MEQNDGGANEDRAESVVQTSDGGYALAGNTWSFAAEAVDFWLVKTYANGTKQWDKAYGAGDWEGAYSVIQTGDGGYALAGEAWETSARKYFWLVKTDSSRTKQWDKKYGAAGYTHQGAYCVIQTSDGGYALVGFTAYGTPDVDILLLKTDSSGTKQWDKTFGGAKNDQAHSVVQTLDGGYALAGGTHSYGAGDCDGWLFKTGVESGLAWTDSTIDTITLYRGATDAYWNYVRVRIWKIKETP